MTDIQVYEVPRKAQWWMVDFHVQDGLDTHHRFTDYTSDVQDEDGNTYTSCPSMAVQLPEMTGVLDKKPAIIEGPTTVSFFDRVSNGEPYPEVIVTIRESMQTFAGDAEFGPYSFEAVQFHGRVGDYFRNSGGRSDSARIEVISVKGWLEVPLGVPCTLECQNIFRQAPCGAEAEAAAEEQNTTITAINGAVVTTTGLGTPPGAFTDQYDRGVMVNVADGVRIGIRYWRNATAATFHLVEPPPASWAGSVVRLKPGCRKTPTDCAAWNQILNFNGAGIKMPNRQPVQEIG